MYKWIQMIFVLGLLTFCWVPTTADTDIIEPTSNVVIIEEDPPVVEEPVIEEPILTTTRRIDTYEDFIFVEEEPMLSDEEIELVALVTMAEAEGECEKGKRLVIDTILNRLDSEHFPDTIRDVIYQKNQFTSMWNGRVNRVTATEEVRQLVREELEIRTNDDVIFFTANQYGKYGDPLFQVGNHYFSSYQ